VKVFHNNQKLKQYMTTKPPIQKILKGVLQKTKANKTMKGWDILKTRRRKDKYSESNTELAETTQTLKKQKQLNGRNHHVLINSNNEC
jgi:hypothetical protein